MVKKFILGIVVSIAVTAIGHGVVYAFGLDRWIARIIHMVATSENLTAIAWVVSGSLGLLALGAWLAFRVDERLYSLLSPVPTLGSLAYSNFTSHINISAATKQANVEMVVTLQNKNPHLVRHNARLLAQVNGQDYVDATGNKVLTFDGYAHPEHPLSLILRMPNVQVEPSNGWCRVKGVFEYDLRYFYPEGGLGPRRSRRTRKKIEFQSSFPVTSTPGTRQESHLHVLFLEELEE